MPAAYELKSAATSRDGHGSFQGPSSYPQLGWWSLIGDVLPLVIEKLTELSISFTIINHHGQD